MTDGTVLFVTCERCGGAVTRLVDYKQDIDIMREQFGEEIPGARYRHDPTAPWPHGKRIHGGATWYGLPDDEVVRETRSHTTKSGRLILICAHKQDGLPCGNRAEFDHSTWQSIAAYVFAVGIERVSLAEMRYAARVSHLPGTELHG